MNLKKLLLVMLLVLIASSVSAQDETAYEILFYDTAQIHVLTQDGLVGTLPIPPEAEGIVPFTGLEYMRLSADRQRLVYVEGIRDSDGSHAVVQIADLENQTCCVTVQMPEGAVVDTVSVGPFSPDGTQVVVTLAHVYTETPSLTPVLALVNLADGTLAQTLDLVATFSDQGALLLDWTDEGILLTPNCLACEGRISGFYHLWNPATGELTRDVQYFNFFGDYLPVSNEFVIALQDESYPISEWMDLFPPANVIQYLPDGDPEQGQVVYHDPENLDLAHPHWVADGRAYLLHNWGDTTATLVHRSGFVREIEIPADLHFIQATPDGWLMQRFEQDLYQFQLDGNEVNHSFWLDIAGPVKVLDAPLLGQAGLEPLTAVTRSSDQ